MYIDLYTMLYGRRYVLPSRIDRHPGESMTTRRASRAGAAALPMTTARVRLFQLAEDVLTGRVSRVALSHKGYDDDVVLIRARDLARLEADLTALRARVGPEPRPLRGLGRLSAPAEDVVARVRAQQAALAEAKRRDLLGDPPSASPVPNEPRAPAAPARRRAPKRAAE